MTPLIVRRTQWMLNEYLWAVFPHSMTLIKKKKKKKKTLTTAVIFVI